MRRRPLLLPTAALALLGLVACSGGPDGDEPTGSAASEASGQTEASAAVERPGPADLEPAPELDPRFDCLAELPDAQWLTGEVDGLEVGAAILGAGEVLVVLSHQADGNLCSWAGTARDLAAEGYLVALPTYATGDPISLQLGLADYAREQGATDVILVGASMGGTYTIGAAAVMDPAPAGVVALAPAPEFDPPGPVPPVDAVAAASQLTSPLLIIVGSGDGTFPETAATIAEAAGVDAVVQDSSGHGITLIASYDELREQMYDFIANPG